MSRKRYKRAGMASFSDASTKLVSTNVFQVCKQLEADLNVMAESLNNWSWVLWNDLPYAKYVELGFTHNWSGAKIAGRKMLEKISNKIDNDQIDGVDSYRGNQSIANIKKKLDDYFSKEVLALLRSDTREITPIYSGLMAGGVDNIISYAKADKRYRDGNYGGWQLQIGQDV
jgi:hypothetical protein